MAAFARSVEISRRQLKRSAQLLGGDGSMAARGKGIGCKLYPLCAVY